jgi:hypothetical protein
MTFWQSVPIVKNLYILYMDSSNKSLKRQRNQRNKRNQRNQRNQRSKRNQSGGSGATDYAKGVYPELMASPSKDYGSNGNLIQANQSFAMSQRNGSVVPQMGGGGLYPLAPSGVDSDATSAPTTSSSHHVTTGAMPTFAALPTTDSVPTTAGAMPTFAALPTTDSVPTTAGAMPTFAALPTTSGAMPTFAALPTTSGSFPTEGTSLTTGSFPTQAGGAVLSLSPATVGQSEMLKGGKVGLTAMAVPATLLLANQLYSRRSKKQLSKKNNKRYSRRRFRQGRK